jgi:hypothetical protein
LKDQDLLQLIIPEKHRLGTDLMSKLMLQDERVMNIIITAFIGKQQLSK